LDARLKSLNLKAVSVTMAGQGYTHRGNQTTRRVCDYAKDVEAVLAAEGITGPLLVEGSSYGCALALACARHFGERVTHLHVHTAYIPYELRVELMSS
jgi:pimeloyl-ACP methyl ester carboxylesterase